jgi:hypothetical protein
LFILQRWCCKLELNPGLYFLFPFTSGCHLKNRNDPSITPVKLFSKDLNNQKTISRQYRDALSVIFDLCDLDGNGRLSHEELSLQNSLTDDEILPDDMWQFIGETVGFEKGELTKDGFTEMFVMEAQQKDVNMDEVANRLANMGFNLGLKIDHASPYTITVAAEVDCFEILLGEIYKLKTAEAFIFQLMEAQVS